MITAKVKCYNKVANEPDGNVSLAFNANYRDDDGNLINQEWAFATPHLGISMTVNRATGDLFEQGKEYTLTFEVEETDGESDARVGTDVHGA